jgi:hypothetical protein
MADHEPGHGPVGGTEAAVAAGDEAVRAYLAGRDAPCPSCGYNLKGVESAACPECGSRLELSLARPGPGRGWVAFAALALAWLFLAGGMNTTRNVVRLVEQKRQMQQVRGWSGFTIQMGPMTMPQLPRLTFPRGLGSPGGGSGGAGGSSGDPMQDMMDQMERDMQQQMQQLQQWQQSVQGSPRAPAFRYQSRPAVAPQVTWLAAWRAQGVQQQIAGVWGAILVVGGLLGLLLLAVFRKRPGAVRRLSALAAGLFVVYAGWHIVLFAREMAGL